MYNLFLEEKKSVFVVRSVLAAKNQLENLKANQGHLV